MEPPENAVHLSIERTAFVLPGGGIVIDDGKQRHFIHAAGVALIIRTLESLSPETLNNCLADVGAKTRF